MDACVVAGQRAVGFWCPASPISLRACIVRVRHRHGRVRRIEIGIDERNATRQSIQCDHHHVDCQRTLGSFVGLRSGRLLCAANTFAGGRALGMCMGSDSGLASCDGYPLHRATQHDSSLTNVGSAHGLLFGLLGAGLGLMVGGFTKNSQQLVNHLIKGTLAGVAGGFVYAILVAS